MITDPWLCGWLIHVWSKITERIPNVINHSIVIYDIIPSTWIMNENIIKWILCTNFMIRLKREPDLIEGHFFVADCWLWKDGLTTKALIKKSNTVVCPVQELVSTTLGQTYIAFSICWAIFKLLMSRFSTFSAVLQFGVQTLDQSVTDWSKLTGPNNVFRFNFQVYRWCVGPDKHFFWGYRH